MNSGKESQVRRRQALALPHEQRDSGL
jgi:hypothetical protein